MNASPKVTLTIELRALRELFCAGNRTAGCVDMTDADPLALALDIIDHAAESLDMLNFAIRGDTDEVFQDDIALHAWRISKQITAGTALVNALRLSNCAREAAAEAQAQPVGLHVVPDGAV